VVVEPAPVALGAVVDLDAGVMFDVQCDMAAWTIHGLSLRGSKWCAGKGPIADLSTLD